MGVVCKLKSYVIPENSEILFEAYVQYKDMVKRHEIPKLAIGIWILDDNMMNEVENFHKYSDSKIKRKKPNYIDLLVVS